MGNKKNKKKIQAIVESGIIEELMLKAITNKHVVNAFYEALLNASEQKELKKESLEQHYVNKCVVIAGINNATWKDLTASEIMEHLPYKDKLSVIKVGKALNKINGISKRMIRGINHYAIKDIKQLKNEE